MKLWAIGLAASVLMIVPKVAAAQAPGQGARTDIGAKQGSQAFTVRKHFIVWGAMGLDLDVIGDVTSQAVGTIRGTAVGVETTAYTDVYVRTPRRRYLGVGYGLFKKAEVFARYTEADNPASTVVVGKLVNNNTFGVSFDNYKDRLVEFGIRKYIATPKTSREYFALTGGMKTVEPIGITMQAPGGNVRTELYSKSHMLSIGVEVGISLEFHKIGVFAESGMRYQKRLTRNDTDLAPYGLDRLNDTGIRIFMPANFGLLIRF